MPQGIHASAKPCCSDAWRALSTETTWFTLIPLSVIGALTAAGFLCGKETLHFLETVPWLLALVAVGLPHGAADLTLLRNTHGDTIARRFFGIYVGGMIAVLASLVLVPVLTLAGFLLASLWHFGHAEATPAGTAGSLPMRICASLARGGLVVGMALAASPEATAAVANELLQLLAPVRTLLALLPTTPAALLPKDISVFGLGLLAMSACGWVGELAFDLTPPSRLRLQRSLKDFGTFTLIGALCYTTPPLLAVGVFFLAWHAWRQTQIVYTLLRPGTQRTHPLTQAAVVHLAAIPLLLPAWLMLSAAWWFSSANHSIRDAAILSLLVYLVVTPSPELLCLFWREPPAAASPGVS
jgi:Brp/Blh family beta-carotene 15,15'-monooxygenase